MNAFKLEQTRSGQFIVYRKVPGLIFSRWQHLGQFKTKKAAEDEIKFWAQPAPLPSPVFYDDYGNEIVDWDF